MILLSGAYCLIRDKYVDHRGWLVVHSDIWASEDDCKAGNPPALQSCHDFKAGLENRSDFHDLLWGAIESEVLGGYHGYRRDNNRKRGVFDPHGVLAHPRVQAIEVTP